MATEIRTINRKTSNYLRASQNLSTISREYSDKASSAKGWDSAIQTIAGIGGTVGQLISSPWLQGISAGVSALSSWITGGIAKDNTKKANAASDAATYMAEYANALTERDSLIMNAMQGIESGRQQMRSQYGAEFENLIYNFYLAKSGVSPDTYSLLNGNFQTFENIGYGRQSETITNSQVERAGAGIPDMGGILAEYNKLPTGLDSLTQGESNFFKTMYKAISSGDLKPILNDLVKALYGSDSTIGMQLKSYEVEARKILEEGLAANTETLLDAEGNLRVTGISKQEQSIQSAEQMGSAQAERASSGMRGGTASNNEKLVQLQKDLNEMKGMAQASVVLRSLQYSLNKIRQNTAYSVLTNRLNQKAIIQQAKDTATINLSAMGMTANESQYKMNQTLETAKGYEKEIENYRSEYRSDYDRMIRAWE